jgi:ABC-type phosphate/phosphonate transport system substrate-binding protein
MLPGSAATRPVDHRERDLARAAVSIAKTTIFAVACLALAALGVSPASRAQSTDLVFAVTEGVTYQATPKEIRDKFEPLVEVIGKALQRRVRMILVPAYDDVRAGLARQEYDVAFIHPAHVAMAEIKAGRYHSVAWTAGYTEYTVSLMSKPQAPYAALRDVKGTVLVTPDPDSITAVMVRAMLRTENFRPGDVKVITTRYQDAVPFYLEYDFAQVGATAANAVVKQWTEKGGKVFARSRSVPIKQIVMSSRLSAEERAKLRDALVALAQHDAGRRALLVTGYKGFVAPDPGVEASAIAWLGL